MNENPLAPILLRVRDQYSTAVRWSYLVVVLLLLIHLITVRPFVELSRQKTKTEAEQERLSGVKSQIEKLATGFTHLKEANLSKLDERLDGLVSGLRHDFERLDLAVKDQRKRTKTLSESLPEQIKLMIPPDRRAIPEFLLGAQAMLDFLKDFREIPEDETDLPEEVQNQLRKEIQSPMFRESIESDLRQKMRRISKPVSPDARIQEDHGYEIVEPPLRISDLDVLNKVNSAETRQQLLIALKPYVEDNIIKPKYVALSEDWKAEILPAIQEQLGYVARQMEKASSKYPEGLEQWKDLAEDLETTRLTASSLEFVPPTDPPFWWSTLEGKDQVRIELSDTVASQLQGPAVLDSLRNQVSALLDDQKELDKDIAAKLEQLAQQFKEQRAKLASLGKPLEFIALELDSVMVLFPLLLGLILAAITVWTTLRLHELGWTTHFMIQQGAAPLLWDWYCAQALVLLPKPSKDLPAVTGRKLREQGKSSLIRQAIGLCAVFWIWIGIAAWRLHGVGEIELGRLILVTSIGAILVALAQFYRYMLLNSVLSLRPARVASGAAASQE